MRAFLYSATPAWQLCVASTPSKKEKDKVNKIQKKRSRVATLCCQHNLQKKKDKVNKSK
jgi:hypothetical protein